MNKLTEKDIDNLAAILDYRDAAMMNIFQIGEASNRLSDECKALLAAPWHEIYGTRNIIAHGYVKVNDRIIWNIITQDIQALKREICSKAGLL